MHKQTRHSLLRRILFPYSGEEPLTRKQALHVIGIWALFFSCALFLCTLPIALAFVGSAPITRIAAFLLIAFLSEVFIFGSLAWFVVMVNNRAARILQHKAARTGSTNGGRYGS
ncbi:MAG: hypothetical protein JO031_04495 [Ktedonobacteraceae bacterium]|nr:hypothetical protein [Ktedonobacteraceae bacterium]